MTQTGSELVVAGAKAFAAQEWTPAKVELLARTLAPGLSADEMSLFIGVSNAVALDPLRKEIYGIKRGGKLTIQTGIDGYRKIALRTGEYRGQVGPYWCGDDGAWKDVWVHDTPPVAAKVGVLRTGFDEPVYAVALFREYNQGSGQWPKMPANQLSKCAEALAIRKAFPDDVAGIYTNEEMAQAGNDEFEIIDAIDTVALVQAAWTQYRQAVGDKDVADASALDLVRVVDPDAKAASDLTDDQRIELVSLLEQACTAVQTQSDEAGEPEVADFEDVTDDADESESGSLTYAERLAVRGTSTRMAAAEEAGEAA